MISVLGSICVYKVWCVRLDTEMDMCKCARAHSHTSKQPLALVYGRAWEQTAQSSEHTNIHALVLKTLPPGAPGWPSR